MGNTQQEKIPGKTVEIAPIKSGHFVTGNNPGVHTSQGGFGFQAPWTRIAHAQAFLRTHPIQGNTDSPKAPQDGISLANHYWHRASGGYLIEKGLSPISSRRLTATFRGSTDCVTKADDDAYDAPE